MNDEATVATDYIMQGIKISAVIAVGGVGARVNTGQTTIISKNRGLSPITQDQIKDHERKLSEYIANPLAGDNKGFLAAAIAKNDPNLYNKIYLSRIASLQWQIANFKKQLEECERKNGR